MLRKTALCTILVGFSLLAAGSASAQVIQTGSTMDVTLSRDASCIISGNEYASTLLLTPDAASLKDTTVVQPGQGYTHTATISFNQNNNIPTACENLPIAVNLTPGTPTKSNNITLGNVSISGAPTTLRELKDSSITLTLPVEVLSSAEVSEIYYSYPVKISVTGQ